MLNAVGIVIFVWILLFVWGYLYLALVICWRVCLGDVLVWMFWFGYVVFVVFLTGGWLLWWCLCLLMLGCLLLGVLLFFCSIYFLFCDLLLIYRVVFVGLVTLCGLIFSLNLLYLFLCLRCLFCLLFEAWVGWLVTVLF